MMHWRARLIPFGWGVLVDPAARSAWERRLAGCSADVLVVGHTHQVFAERLGATLVVNPGSTCFNHSCALLELPAARVEFLPLSGRAIEPTWNWSGGWGSR
ncbi:MAG TPA: metallophosphoesterase family protein [Gammaproteobacteria bacterium]